MKKPELKPVKAWPPEVREALMTLIAFTVNEGSSTMVFDVFKAKTPDRALGSFEIRVTKTAG